MVNKYSAQDIKQAASQLQSGEKVENKYLRRLARGYIQGKITETGTRKAARGHTLSEYNYPREGLIHRETRQYSNRQIAEMIERLKVEDKRLTPYQRKIAHRYAQNVSLNTLQEKFGTIWNSAFIDEQSIYRLRETGNEALYVATEKGTGNLMFLVKVTSKSSGYTHAQWFDADVLKAAQNGVITEISDRPVETAIFEYLVD
jgi:hypothetical protein